MENGFYYAPWTFTISCDAVWFNKCFSSFPVNIVLRDMLDKFVFVYTDNILIFSRNIEEHVNHAEIVLAAVTQEKNCL